MASSAVVSAEQLGRQISVLKIKIEERLRLCHGDRVTPHVYSVFRKHIIDYLHEMEICVTKMELSPNPETDVLETEADWASQLMEYHRELGELDGSLSQPVTSTFSDPASPSFSAMSAPGRSSASFIVRPPQIQITGPTFSGREMTTDHMSFQNFLSRFENCVAGMANNAERLNFLKCSLTDEALRLIQHLSCTDANYQRALTTLKKKYLDIDEIIDQIFQDILDYVPKKDTAYLEFNEFVSRTASLLEELGNSYFCDFSEDTSAGARLMAKILFQKFPKELKGEMIGLTGKRIPSLSAIFNLTGEASKRLLVKGGACNSSTFNAGRGYYQGSGRKAGATTSFHIDFKSQTSVGYSRSLPPILLVTFTRGEKTVSANCLLDTGSGRSYLSADVLRTMGSMESIGMDCQLRLSTLLGECEQRFREVNLEVDLGSGNALSSPILVANAMDLSVRLTDLDPLLRAFRDADCRLAGRFEVDSDFIPIKGIIGLDLLHQLDPFHLVPCLSGWAFSIPAGLVPFGPVESFISEEEIPHEMAHLSYNSVMEHTPMVDSSHLCFVLERQPSFDDPLAEFFPYSDVERGLEQMFKMESLGIPDQDTFSDYDQQQIKRFQDTIVLKDGKYHVELPWNMDKLARVPSNHAVSLHVLDRVAKKLTKKKLYQEYLEVFRQQEQDGIIEEIFVPPHEFDQYVWIPHRPVFKSDPTATTKIRPVFNCSLKTGLGMSLNEAAYSGVNLTGDMLQLLLSFRANNYVLLADIRKAFLMIRLKLEGDKNRFCFFLRDGDRLRCFRYSTLIFGFTSSPFVLGCILRFHASRYPLDACRRMMESRFYVDNLVALESDPDRLADLYSLARKRLQEGGFTIQSCNSNHEVLRAKMKTDDTLSAQTEEWERVLGYRYNPLSEKIHVAPVKCDPSASTKRGVLSESAKIFDPLSLCLPVTVRSRVLIRTMWQNDYGWDDPLPPEILSVWEDLAEDLSGLSDFHFNRQAVVGGQPGDLYIFCDASKEAYGFAAYIVQDRHSSLMFAKAKIAPMNDKTLPVLELMAVYLALKCLPTILDNCEGFVPTNLVVATDAQVVLSWLLSQTMNSKNIFARNRLKDILQMNLGLESQYGLKPLFKYVATSQNPADLITRGLSIRKFRSNLGLWCSGPSWLSEGILHWPVQDLPCLNEKCQRMAHTSVNCAVILDQESSSIVPFHRFSTFSRLLRVTTMVFRFIAIKLGLDWDHDSKAVIYLMKTLQAQDFLTETEYLKEPLGRSEPKRVRALDLFFDSDGLIRSRGRICRSSYLAYEAKNPILISKHHPITRLIILDCHERCSHLGTGSTLAELRRSGYWVPQGRQAVNKVLSSCARCKRYNSRPVLPSAVASLPTSRADFEVPFQHTGVDFTGHLWVRDGNQDRKVYLLLFTCLNVRAVHIEVVPDMSVLSFFQALSRFTNLNGVPDVIYSDNAKTFLGSGRLFSRLSLLQEYRNKFGTCCMKLKTIPLFSPWYGGTWERCIKTIKTCLYKMVGRGKLDYFTLLTVVSDIQRSVNNRPLTYQVSADNQATAITPNMFLRPNKSPGLLLRLGEDDLTAAVPPGRERLIKTMELRNQWLSEFHELWYNEYLLDLGRKTPGGSRLRSENRLQKGDVVLVKSPLKPRPFWILGIIRDLFPGHDGIVRSARVKRGDGLEEVHSLKHLYPLELSLQSDGSAESQRSVLTQPPENTSVPAEVEEPSCSSPATDEHIWLCPVCSAPQGDLDMIGCDACDEWYHFQCVGIEEAPPRRQKWYCPECAPRKRRRGRPSLLPA